MAETTGTEPETRDQHVAWVKQRALAELDDSQAGVVRAITSVASDLRKHEETAGHTAMHLMTALAVAGHLGTDREVREFIDGIR